MRPAPRGDAGDYSTVSHPKHDTIEASSTQKFEKAKVRPGRLADLGRRADERRQRLVVLFVGRRRRRRRCHCRYNAICVRVTARLGKKTSIAMHAIPGVIRKKSCDVGGPLLLSLRRNRAATHRRVCVRKANLT